MKRGEPVHIGGSHLVHLCHSIAYIYDRAGVLWHTLEGGYVFLWNDATGKLQSQIVVDKRAFLKENSHRRLTVPPEMSRALAQAFFELLTDKK